MAGAGEHPPPKKGGLNHHFAAGQAAGLSRPEAELLLPKGPADLAGKKVAVQKNTTGEDYANKNAEGASIVSGPGVASSAAWRRLRAAAASGTSADLVTCRYPFPARLSPQ